MSSSFIQVIARKPGAVKIHFICSEYNDLVEKLVDLIDKGDHTGEYSIEICSHKYLRDEAMQATMSINAIKTVGDAKLDATFVDYGAFDVDMINDSIDYYMNRGESIYDLFDVWWDEKWIDA